MALSPEQKHANKVLRTYKRFKALTIGRCVNQTATLFQRLVRLRAIEDDGKLTCCSCGKRDFPGNGFDAGHWIGRKSRSTIFDARNCHPQCADCNRYPGGLVSHGYNEFMFKTYGKDQCDQLQRRGHESKQWTKRELAELYVSFLAELAAHKHEQE